MIRVVFIGGFLGAGKTSLILRAAASLRKRGFRVGIVTNDQSTDLVDTRLLQSLDFPVGEVAGGCFCCRFEDLTKAFETVQSAREVDVLLAEPVGSCTDIISTVVRPLAEFGADRYEVAPFSVVVDPTRDPQATGDLTSYLYTRQIAEADAIVVSKMDLAPNGVSVIKERYKGVLPEWEIFPISSLSGEGVDSWLDFVLSAHRGEGASLSLDYQKYAEAEAELGWLNVSGQWQLPREARLRDIGDELLRSLQGVLARESLEAAHVKLMVIANQGQVKGGFTDNKGPSSWEITNASAQAAEGQLVLNARVKALPDALANAVNEALTNVQNSMGLKVSFHQWECFSPKPPRPTYRLNRYGVSVPLECSNPLLAT